MFNEDKFHKIIRQQDLDGKNRVWEKVENQLPEEEKSILEVSNGSTLAISGHKKVLIPVIALACALILVVSAILIVIYNKGKSTSISYYGLDEYSVTSTDLTLKQYNEQLKSPLLYLDLYEGTEYFEGTIYISNDNKKPICIQESILDMNTGYTVELFITDKYTQMFFLDKFSMCENEYVYNNIQVKWALGVLYGMAAFEYNDCKYYLQVAEPDSEEVIIDYVKLLLS